jgi:hypothetical protein
MQPFQTPGSRKVYRDRNNAGTIRRPKVRSGIGEIFKARASWRSPVTTHRAHDASALEQLCNIAWSEAELFTTSTESQPVPPLVFIHTAAAMTDATISVEVSEWRRYSDFLAAEHDPACQSVAIDTARTITALADCSVQGDLDELVRKAIEHVSIIATALPLRPDADRDMDLWLTSLREPAVTRRLPRK